MKSIKHFVRRIDEELNDASYYAEKYVDCKAHGHMDRAEMYHTMAEDEIRHSNYLHQMAVDEINTLKKVYHPTQEMQDKWNASHIQYVDRTEWIKKMLSM